jgi:hypothetical protein
MQTQTENQTLEWPQKGTKSTKTGAHMLECLRFKFLCFFVFFVAIYRVSWACVFSLSCFTWRGQAEAWTPTGEDIGFP